MKIKHNNFETKGEFLALDNGVEVGKMTYSWAGKSKFIIDHTEVNDAFKGQGVGKQLALESIAFARKNNLKIIPLCPFVKSFFDKNPMFRDVL